MNLRQRRAAGIWEGREETGSAGHWAEEERGHDALKTVLAQNQIRVPELVPIRHQRMAASAWNYYRGAAAVMAGDLASQPATHTIAVLRGTSARPLYVTAAGMPRAEAADLVRHMAGPHRMPDALRRADTLARHGLTPAA